MLTLPVFENLGLGLTSSHLFQFCCCATLPISTALPNIFSSYIRLVTPTGPWPTTDGINPQLPSPFQGKRTNEFLQKFNNYLITAREGFTVKFHTEGLNF